ncbi:MAG TPA: DUF4199 domain-containing protein [bacterium]|nr:DUF4199 domain-containing protein [bacterium]
MRKTKNKKNNIFSRGFLIGFLVGIFGIVIVIAGEFFYQKLTNSDPLPMNSDNMCPSRAYCQEAQNYCDGFCIKDDFGWGLGHQTIDNDCIQRCMNEYNSCIGQFDSPPRSQRQPCYSAKYCSDTEARCQSGCVISGIFGINVVKDPVCSQRCMDEHNSCQETARNMYLNR